MLCAAQLNFLLSSTNRLYALYYPVKYKTSKKNLIRYIIGLWVFSAAWGIGCGILTWFAFFKLSDNSYKTRNSMNAIMMIVTTPVLIITWSLTLHKVHKSKEIHQKLSISSMQQHNDKALKVFLIMII